MDLNQEKQAEPSVPKAFVFETRLGRLDLVKKLAVSKRTIQESYSLRYKSSIVERVPFCQPTAELIS